MPVIQVENLHKSFDGRPILAGIGLEIDQGEVVTIIGPSGSGKTTLLRCINFLEPADQGQLMFDNQQYDLTKITKQEVRQIRMQTGFVFQSYNLFANQTALQNVTLGLTVARKIKRQEARQIALQALTEVGMQDYAQSYPDQLSGGQMQRVAIARSLALKPKIIYFDEPTSALDPELTQEVLGVIKNLANKGTTMVVVTHELSFARDISDRVVFVENGQIAAQGTPQGILVKPVNPRLIKFLKKSDFQRE